MADKFSLLSFSKDPYSVLGITSRASALEIKQAYFTLIKQYPPERNPEDFKRIRAAYDLIRSQKTREETNFLLFDEGDVSSDYQALKGPFYNLWDDVLALELWNSVKNDE